VQAFVRGRLRLLCGDGAASRAILAIRESDSTIASDDCFTKTARLATLVYCEYVTETGASWAGAIEHATFTLDTAGLEHAFRLGAAGMLASVDMGNGSAIPPRSMTWRGLNPPGWSTEPAKGRTTVEELKPPLLGPGPADHLEWRFAPFTPGPQLAVTYVSTMLPGDAASVEAFARLIAAEGGLGGPAPTAADIAALRETLAATCGIAPKTERARAVVEHLVWYAPVEGRTEADLTEAQQALLAAFDAQVAGASAGTRDSAEAGPSSSEPSGEPSEVK
jgi:hypothetical protein